jgi:hypothetical protein
MQAPVRDAVRSGGAPRWLPYVADLGPWTAPHAVEIVAVLQPKPHCTHVMEIIHPSLGHGNVRSLARKNKQSKARHGDCTLRVANLGSGK